MPQSETDSRVSKWRKKKGKKLEDEQRSDWKGTKRRLATLVDRTMTVAWGQFRTEGATRCEGRSIGRLPLWHARSLAEAMGGCLVFEATNFEKCSLCEVHHIALASATKEHAHLRKKYTEGEHQSKSSEKMAGQNGYMYICLRAREKPGQINTNFPCKSCISGFLNRRIFLVSPGLFLQELEFAWGILGVIGVSPQKNGNLMSLSKNLTFL